MNSSAKVFGAPLQKLYKELQVLPKAPKQPEVIRSMLKQLQERGIHYHARTLKRQLQGDIEYIPEALEETFIGWLEKTSPSLLAPLMRDFQKEKRLLYQSDDTFLYVSPHFFTEMAEAYLFLHKEISRRQLALLLKAKLAEKNISIGLETLQVALAGKTLKIRKVIEDALQQLFFDEGFHERSQIRQFVEEAKTQGTDEVHKIDIGSTANLVEAFLLKTEGLSKRQLALMLRDRLASKGYRYHLSSIQSILEGKTHKTKRVVLDTLEEIYKAKGVSGRNNIQELLQSLPEEQLHWNQYIDASQLGEKIDKLLHLHPQLTRRRIAIQLQEDLSQRNFNFSLNTLQYILAGKTQRSKKVLMDLLEDYLTEEGSQKLLQAVESGSYRKKGRPSLESKVAEYYQQWKSADEPSSESIHENLLHAREDLIRNRWHKKHPLHTRQSSKSQHRPLFNPNDLTQDDFLSNGLFDSSDIAVAYSVEESMRRMVS